MPGTVEFQSVTYHGDSMGFLSGLSRGYRAFSRQFDNTAEVIGGCIGWVTPWAIVLALALVITIFFGRRCYEERSVVGAEDLPAKEQLVARASRSHRQTTTTKPSPKTGRVLRAPDAAPLNTANTPRDSDAAETSTAPPEGLRERVELEVNTGASSVDTSETSRTSRAFGIDMMLQKIGQGETVDVHVRYDAKATNSERGERLMLCCVVSLVDGVVSLSRGRLTFKSNDGANDFSVPYEKIASLSDQSVASNRISLRVMLPKSTRDREYIKRLYLYNHAAIAPRSKSGPDDVICGSCDNSLDELYTLIKVLRKDR